MDLSGDVLKALGSMIHGVHGRDVGQQGLGGADVAGGLVSPDVLLPGLQRQAEAVMTLHVLGDPNHAARHVPHKLLLSRKEAGVRSSIAQWYSKPLAGAECDVHPKLPRRLHHGEGHQVSGTDGQGPRGPGQVRLLNI